MNFGNPFSQQQCDLFPAIPKDEADGVNKFKLTEEELAYVRSIDNQQMAAKESMEAMIETVQASYAKTLARIGVMKDEFVRFLANKHKVPLTKHSSVAPLSGLFIADTQLESNKQKENDMSTDDILNALEKEISKNPSAVPPAIADTLKVFHDAEKGKASVEDLVAIGHKSAEAVIRGSKMTSSDCKNVLDYILCLKENLNISCTDKAMVAKVADALHSLRCCFDSLGSADVDLKPLLHHYCQGDAESFKKELNHVLDPEKRATADELHKRNALSIMRGMVLTYYCVANAFQ